MIAHLNIADIGSDRLYHPCTFVAEDHGPRAIERAVEIVVVAVAQPRRDPLHQYLATDRLVVFDIRDGELVGIVEKTEARTAGA